MKNTKKKSISYYTGLGVAYGTCFGTVIGIFNVDTMPIFMFLGIAFGAVIGTAYGKSKSQTSSK